MENKSRSSDSVYAQIMHWERAKRLAEYQQEQLEQFLTTSKPRHSTHKKTSTYSHFSQSQSSLNSGKNASKTRLSAVTILILGWLMGMLTHWSFTQFAANSAAVTERQNSVLLRSYSSSDPQFFA